MFGKQKFAQALKAKLGITNEKSEELYDVFVDIIKDAAESDTVRLSGIGVIRKNDIPAHEALNPATGSKVQVPNRFNYRMSSQTQDIE